MVLIAKYIVTVNYYLSILYYIYYTHNNYYHFPCVVQRILVATPMHTVSLVASYHGKLSLLPSLIIKFI